VKIRQSARLVILNQRDEVFLFHHQEGTPVDPANPVTRRYWVTPGGGVEPGEAWEAAALRELWEETGIEGVELGPWVWSREKEGLIFGEWMRSVERYYLVRVGDITISTANQFNYEQAAYQRHGWWSVDAIRTSTEVFFPEGLADHLDRLLAGHSSSPPLDISPS
jgi:8-oxo-dGTP pyrophosphatase MutT (NUDIX family)